MIYLDNCATTKPRKEVIDFLIDSYERDFGNPSSLHSFGLEMEEKISKSRDIISKFLNINPKEFYFTSGGTESNNIFIKGVLDNSKLNQKIITTKLEHSAVLEVMKKYEDLGFEVIYLDSDEYGIVDLDELKATMDENVALVSIMHVNNEIGYINDIKKACSIVKEINKNTLFHSDGVQGFGKIPVDLKDLGVDAYSISGHKIHSVKGVGGLYIKKGVNLNPLIQGGGQESGIRSGTENANGIFALSKAVEILMENFEVEDKKKGILKNKVVEYLKDNIEDFVINTPLDKSPNSILNVSFLNTRGEVILHYLEQDDIYISTTSACSSNKKTKTNLEKLNKDSNICDGSIRICFSYENTKEDIDFFLEKLNLAVEDIRKITMRKRWD